MTRLLRKTSVILLVLLWTSAGAYATVCRAICAEHDGVQQVTQASAVRVVQSGAASGMIANGPADQNSQCVDNLDPGRFLVGSLPQVNLEILSVRPLLAEVARPAPVFEPGSGSHTHSPPSLSSGRSICTKLTLRI